MAKKSRYLQPDKTEKVYSSPRQENTFLYFTGAGDNIDTGAIGEGESLFITNSEGSQCATKTTQFNEDIYLKDGYIFWENAVVGDRVSLVIYLPANTPMPVDTENGNAGVIDKEGTISYITASQEPDDSWVGTHYLFPMDTNMFRFVNKFHLMGTNTHGLCIESPDAVMLDKELRFRLELNSPSGNENVLVSVMMEMYRENTI